MSPILPFSVSIDNMKTHPIYTDYAADEVGNIFTMKKWRCNPNGEVRKLAMSTTRSGHHRFTIVHNGKDISKHAHHFIWECFHNELPNWSGWSPDAITINHIDGNASNNAITNLEIMTLSKNSSIGYKPGFTGKHTDETKSKLKEARRQQDIRQGNPALGSKRTDEWKKKKSKEVKLWWKKHKEFAAA